MKVQRVESIYNTVKVKFFLGQDSILDCAHIYFCRGTAQLLVSDKTETFAQYEIRRVRFLAEKVRLYG